MCFKWCLIDKAQLLISSEMNGKQLGKPTRQGRTPRAVASFLLQNSPNPSWQKQGRALLTPSWGWSPLSPPISSPRSPNHHWGTAMPRWHQPHFGAACLAQVQCREPPPRPSAKHSAARAQPEMLLSLGSGGRAGWIHAAHPQAWQALGVMGPSAGTEPAIAGPAKCDLQGQTRCRQGQAVLLGTGAEHQGWAQLCCWHVRAGAGRPRCQAGLAASWHSREAAGSASSGHHPGAGERQQGDRPSSTLLPFSPCDEPPTACHHAECPQGNGSFPSSCWGPQHGQQGMGRR